MNNSELAKRIRAAVNDFEGYCLVAELSQKQFFHGFLIGLFMGVGLAIAVWSVL